MADVWLETVEDRVAKLEQFIFGDNDKDAMYPRCIDTLGAINTKLVSGVTGKEKFAKILNRLPEVERYMDHGFTDRLTLSDPAKLDILLAEEDWIKKQAADLERLQELQKILDSEHLKVIPSLNEKFQELTKRHIEQQDRVAEFSEETKDLLNQYQSVVNLISKEFVMWDQMVTESERKALPKKVDS
ncbi:dynactin subunit 3-like isoform X2 [Tubulanus polymorphus]|uniref:dynactin subunit 3-like isoform X2 n=1 Tax=Tubulanus polymorphus TaxID=672921 RepID=UPI003DA1EDF6